MENLTQYLDNAMNSFYSVSPNTDGTYTVETCYNVSVLRYTPATVYRSQRADWVSVKRNKK